ncbi:PAS domain-containing protein, partial [Halomonas sp.]|uniref:PAS domain-containing protein n=1 Tax=Halomonas sp. TaxID=1486246 RepID=UPI0025B876A9
MSRVNAMWPPFSLNRPLMWVGLAGLTFSVWLPDLVLRAVAITLVGLGLADAWRQVRREHQHSRLGQEALALTEDGVIVTDADNRILAVNPAFTRITGFSFGEVRGRNATSLSASRHDTAFFEGFRETLRSTGRWEGEMWNRRKHGDEYPEWLRVRAISDA